MSDPLTGIPFGGDLTLPSPAGSPSVAVLVDLVRTGSAGGQVKCWERFAEAAAGLHAAELGVDLTLYVLGDRPRMEPLSPAVRFVTLPPLISTAPLVRNRGVDVCDVAPHHPALGRLLPFHDVWHLTHVFSFAATAVRLSRAQRRSALPNRAGLVGSVHTDVPALTALFVQELTGRRTGRGAHAAAEAGAALVRRRRDRILRACDRVMVSTHAERAEIAAVVGAQRVSLLGRGVDHTRFRPDPSARAELTRLLGIPPDPVRVLFAGRVDSSKRVMLAAEAVRLLRQRGRSAHLVVAGAGQDSARVAGLLSGGATLLGTLDQDRLARVYAGCDLFVFPSLTETIGNVVGEAMACGLPVVLPAGARTTQWLAAPGRDGLTVSDDSPAGWADVLTALADDPGERAAMGRRAAASAAARHRTWAEVLTEDLLPVWRAVAPLPAPADG
ncbi:glycosyltransferase [Streptomyces sp. PR69]|uniref:glycosyltransferase n=1 Tax=Streptomyces sp. PR69 TaxID=2984950 RepID=UPI0022654383|nr:glycosyltransferase [Streptomyces sp. PR69]